MVGFVLFVYFQLIVNQERYVKEFKDSFDLARSECEIERQRDCDALEAEKYALVELEEEERINSLVDQEVSVRKESTHSFQ